MADTTTTTEADLMRAYRERLVLNLPKKSVFLAEIRKDKDQKRWDGLKIEIPVILSPVLQGAQAITETGTVGDAYTDDTLKSSVTTGVINQVVSLSTQVIKQLRAGTAINETDDPRTAVDALKFKVQRAEQAIAMLANECAVGSGDGLLAAATGTQTANNLVTVGTTANWFLLYRHRMIDIRTRSTGASIAAKRKITDVDPVAGTITFDGGTATTTNAAGVYIVNTGLLGSGNATPPQGFGQIFATTGTFQGINVANYPDFRGTDASPASATDPTKAVFDAAERKAYRESGTTPDWYSIDPAVAAKYGDLYMDRVRWIMPKAKLDTGFEGYEYKGKALIEMYEMPAGTAYGVYKDDIRIYTLDDGPDWDDQTGAIWQRFARTLVMEAW
nr:hypothetical protein [Propionibacteriales bacterium]